jgi:hypothetical protein
MPLSGIIRAMKNARSLIYSLVLAGCTAIASTATAQSVTPRAVVELYTSQGCNSCPPADRVLYELNQEHSDLLLLSYHVDYWNYLGWTDPFSNADYSARQRDYANRMRERYVYTPQVIINGDNVVRATQKRRIETTSNAIAPLPDLATIQLGKPNVGQAANGTVTLNGSGRASANQGSLIWMIAFDREHQRDVLSGENAGKRLVHANVVREMVSLGSWNGASRDIPFAMGTITDGGIAVLVQDGRGGPIIGASMIQF